MPRITSRSTLFDTTKLSRFHIDPKEMQSDSANFEAGSTPGLKVSANYKEVLRLFDQTYQTRTIE